MTMEMAQLLASETELEVGTSEGDQMTELVVNTQATEQSF